MTIFVVIDDPYNLRHISAFSTEDKAKAYQANNHSEEYIELELDKDEGCKEYRVYTIEVSVETGKHLSENWNDVVSVAPPPVPASRTYQYEYWDCGFVNVGWEIEQKTPKLVQGEMRSVGSGLGYDDAKKAAHAERERYLSEKSQP